MDYGRVACQECACCRLFWCVTVAMLTMWRTSLKVGGMKRRWVMRVRLSYCSTNNGSQTRGTRRDGEIECVVCMCCAANTHRMWYLTQSTLQVQRHKVRTNAWRCSVMVVIVSCKQCSRLVWQHSGSRWPAGLTVLGELALSVFALLAEINVLIKHGLQRGSPRLESGVVGATRNSGGSGRFLPALRRTPQWWSWQQYHRDSAECTCGSN